MSIEMHSYAIRNRPEPASALSKENASISSRKDSKIAPIKGIDSRNTSTSKSQANSTTSRPLLVKDSALKKSVAKLQEGVAKFDDPLAGLTAMLLNLSPEKAKEIGIY